jgi:hypothetical protein
MMELPHARDAASADFGREDRPEPVPPELHALVADLDAALVQHVLDVPQGKREPDVEHHREADDLGARLEVPERVALLHPPKLRPCMGSCNEVPLTLLCHGTLSHPSNPYRIRAHRPGVCKV